MTEDCFSAVKNAIPAADAAKHYGFQPNHAGFIKCPFHQDKTASLKLYAGVAGFYCFGCGTGGSVIDFVARLFNLKPLEAVKQLNRDFDLGLSFDAPQAGGTDLARRRTELAETRRRFEEWKERCLVDLTASYRVGFTALRDSSPSEWTERDLLAVKNLATIENWIDALNDRSMEDEITVFRDRQEMYKLCQMILRSSPQRSRPD